MKKGKELSTPKSLGLSFPSECALLLLLGSVFVFQDRTIQMRKSSSAREGQGSKWEKNSKIFRCGLGGGGGGGGAGRKGAGGCFSLLSFSRLACGSGLRTASSRKKEIQLWELQMSGRRGGAGFTTEREPLRPCEFLAWSEAVLVPRPCSPAHGGCRRQPESRNLPPPSQCAHCSFKPPKRWAPESVNLPLGP